MMKKICFLCIVCLFCLSCGRKTKKEGGISLDIIEIPATYSGNEKVKMPIITFEKDIHDFGRLTQGENISYSFKFANTGNADMIITCCEASCGCTVADFPKGIIKPKETGYVTVSFNSRGKIGQQYQEVTVIANTQPSSTKLIIRSQVENR